MKILLLHRTLANDYTFNRLYAEPLNQIMTAETFTQAELYYPQGVKKVKADDKKQWLNSIGSKLDNFDVILVSDGDYFKTIAGTSKAEGTIGNLYDSQYTKAKIMYVPSVSACTYHPDKNLPKLQLAFQTLKDLSKNEYTERGANIIHSYWHPKTLFEIQVALAHLKHFPALTIDIEAESLAFVDAGIYTIAFAWDKHNYIAFPVDALPTINDKYKVRKLLKNFFDEYKGKKIIHKCNYDVTVMNYVLYQNEDITDVENQVKGLNKFFGENIDEIEDTLIITYLATNSTAGNTLGLKELASEFAGDWAVDVSDVTTVPLDDLLKYNGIDCLSTWYVYNKYYPMMVKDEQEDLYKTFMLPTLKANIRCQLNGLPIDINKVYELDRKLQKEHWDLETKLRKTKEVTEAEWAIAEQVTNKRNAKLKKKQTTVQENYLPMNFGSNKQLQTLVYDVMALPVIERTETKEPAVGKKVLKNLINHTDNQQYKEILQTLCDLADVSKIESAFIPAFKEAPKTNKDFYRLHGYFNLGGTVSGRLSSNQPNLQNLPATGSRFAKPVKKLFTSNSDWIFCGIDFSSLEDRISALTTKDPEKLKVYINNYDGHSLRAYAYFKDEMPDIILAEDSDICYSAKIKGKTFVWKATDIVVYKQQQMTGKDLYELVANKKF